MKEAEQVTAEKRFQTSTENEAEVWADKEKEMGADVPSCVQSSPHLIKQAGLFLNIHCPSTPAWLMKDGGGEKMEKKKNR